MQNLEISPKDLLAEIRQVGQLVSKIHVDVEVMKTQVLNQYSIMDEKVKGLESDVKELRDKVTGRDRAFVATFITVGLGGIVTFLLNAVR